MCSCRTSEGEWIHPDRATPDEVAHLALVCPSGAITYERLDGGPQEAPPKVNTVHVRENGPLALHAPHAVADQPPALRATLCRCGASQNKPWCDGSHTAIGFQATGEPATQAIAAAQHRAMDRSRSHRRWTGRSSSKARSSWSLARGEPSIASPRPGSAAAAPRATSRTATAVIAGSDSRAELTAAARRTVT